MTRQSPTPLAVRLLDLLQAEFGNPMPGGQEQDRRSAVARLIGLAAQQAALRELIAHDENVWDRLKATPAQRRGH